MGGTLREQLEEEGWAWTEIRDLEGGAGGWEGVVGCDGKGRRYKLRAAVRREGDVALALMVWPKMGMFWWKHFVGDLAGDAVARIGPAVVWIGNKGRVELDQRGVAGWVECEE